MPKATTLIRPSDDMQRTIARLADAYGIDLTRTGALIRLEMPGMNTIEIETLAPGLVVVGQYVDVAGECRADPAIVFHVSPAEGQWYACAVVHVDGRELRLLDLPADGPPVTTERARQRQTASYANLLARTLDEQRWRERARCTRLSAGLAQRAPLPPQPAEESPAAR